MAAQDNICRLTRALFGHAVNPHLFRDSTATSIAIEDAEHVYIVRSFVIRQQTSSLLAADPAVAGGVSSPPENQWSVSHACCGLCPV
jgi:hypothetical protein